MKRWIYNPVLASSLKTRMRGWRTPAAVTAYLGVMLFIAYIFFKVSIENEVTYYLSISSSRSAGLRVYQMLAVLQFALILLVTPAQTAGVISSEREMQTLDLLLCTKMSPLSIIIGKLLSALAFILLLIVSSMPIFSLVFLFGGIAPGDIATLFVFYIITAFAVGSIGVFYSALFKRTVVSTVVTYITVFFLGIISMILGAYMASVYYSQVPRPTDYYFPFVLYINPAVGLGDLLTRQAGVLAPNVHYGILGLFVGVGAGAGRPQGWFYSLPIWMGNSIVMSVIAAALILASAWVIRPYKGLWRKNA